MPLIQLELTVLEESLQLLGQGPLETQINLNLTREHVPPNTLSRCPNKTRFNQEIKALERKQYKKKIKTIKALEKLQIVHSQNGLSQIQDHIKAQQKFTV